MLIRFDIWNESDEAGKQKKQNEFHEPFSLQPKTGKKRKKIS